jgi:tRNA (cmo5U34)-methyltransferase
MKDKKDFIYSQYREKVADFVFDSKVVSVFDDMIRRSVPGYATVIAMTKVFAQQYAIAGSNCYDLGCSLGAGTLAMRKGIEGRGCQITAVDNSRAMVDRCKEIIQSDISDVKVNVILGDIRDIRIENASVVVLNFTLQFLAPQVRDELIKRIYNGMIPGGVLVLSEKIAFENDTENNFQINMYHDFKKLNGYSDTEVSQKRKALDNVLIPDSLPSHFDRLAGAGFDEYYMWFQCFNFCSMAAFKK